MAVIAIDGVSASGKGTLARALSQHYRWFHFDTGSLYRLVGMIFLKEGFSTEDSADKISSFFEHVPRAKVLEGYRNIDNILESLRTPAVDTCASFLAQDSRVREMLLDVQRALIQERQARYGGCVVDGRDIGTVVWPHADAKFFLTATLCVRAQRRFLQQKDFVVNQKDVEKSLQERDERDESRILAPLKPAHDALVIDTSTCSAQDVFESAIHFLKNTLRKELL